MRFTLLIMMRIFCPSFVTFSLSLVALACSSTPAPATSSPVYADDVGAKLTPLPVSRLSVDEPQATEVKPTSKKSPAAKNDDAGTPPIDTEEASEKSSAQLESNSKNSKGDTPSSAPVPEVSIVRPASEQSTEPRQ